MSFLEDTSSSLEASSQQILLTASEDTVFSSAVDSMALYSYEIPGNESSNEFPTGDIFRIQNPASFSHTFGIIEYVVFVSVLACSIAIGIFYWVCGNAKKSTDEYLMGNREMGVLPVSLSLLCSFVSAITVLGNPIEIYYYGSTYALILVSFVPMTLSLAYCYVPVYHNLQLSSAYEYLELRFNRYVRVAASLLGIVQYVFYMSIVVYGPSLALSQVTGIETKVACSVIFSVCIFYSTLGGLKAVIWTDAIQAVIMIGSLTAIVAKGISDTGGFQVVWNVAMEGGRTQFLNFDIDPTVRHTVFTSIIGGYFMWLGNFAATHSQVQRYLAIPTLARIRTALLLNFFGLIIIFGLCYLAGLALYVRYYACDPIQTGAVHRPDQLLPLYVMETLGENRGFPGLFVAGITCASLSSVSSGLNSLAAILTYDYVKQWFPNSTDLTLLRLSKTFCLLFGIISFGFVFLAENLGENILPITFSICGGVIGPILGVFSLGLFFPFANSKGALLGLLTSVGAILSLIVCKQLFIAEHPGVHRDQRLPGLSVTGCSDFDYYHHNNSFLLNSTNDLPHPKTERVTESLPNLHRQPLIKPFDGETMIFITEISYMWYPCIGCCLSVLFGLVFSFLLKRFDKSRGVNPDYMSPVALSILTKLFPNQIMNWIEVDGYPMLPSGGCSFTMSVRNDFSFNKESMCDMKLKRLSGF